jgi:hypothetical protein
VAVAAAASGQATSGGSAMAGLPSSAALSASDATGHRSSKGISVTKKLWDVKVSKVRRRCLRACWMCACVSVPMTVATWVCASWPRAVMHPHLGHAVSGISASCQARLALYLHNVRSLSVL